MAEQQQSYYVPPSSIWPIVGALGLGLIAWGAAHTVIEATSDTQGWGSHVSFRRIWCHCGDAVRLVPRSDQ